MYLILGSLFYSINPCILFLCHYHTLLIVIDLCYSLKSRSVISPVLQFFIKIALAIESLLSVPINTYCTVALISHASKIMIKILKGRFQQYVNRELPYVQDGFRKGRKTRDQIANIHWIMEKAKEFQKNIYFCFIDYDKAFDCVDHNQLWKIPKEMGIPDHLLRNLYADQGATARTGQVTTDWSQIGKGACQGCILSPCLFNFYAEYIMRNNGLEEAQAGLKIARRNIKSLRYADDTTLMAESKKELKSLLIK